MIVIRVSYSERRRTTKLLAPSWRLSNYGYSNQKGGGGGEGALFWGLLSLAVCSSALIIPAYNGPVCAQSVELANIKSDLTEYGVP